MGFNFDLNCRTLTVALWRWFVVPRSVPETVWIRDTRNDSLKWHRSWGTNQIPHELQTSACVSHSAAVNWRDTDVIAIIAKNCKVYKRLQGLARARRVGDATMMIMIMLSSGGGNTQSRDHSPVQDSHPVGSVVRIMRYINTDTHGAR